MPRNGPLAPLVALALLVSGAACSTTPADQNAPAQAGAAASVSSGSCAADPEGALDAWADAGFSGAVVVNTRGDIDCAAGHGLADPGSDIPNTPDTVFAIASVSKAFTAAAILDLAADDMLALDDRAGDLLPTLQGPVADATVEHLLLHTSGLTGTHGTDHQPLDRDDAITALGELGVGSAPGTDYSYSNAGYTLLALIVDELTDDGDGYRDHLVSEILTSAEGELVGGFWDGEPAAPTPRAVGQPEGGPPATGDFDGPHWALDGNGDLAMSATHLAGWTEAFFTGQVISTEAVELFHDTRFATEDGNEAPGWLELDAATYGAPALVAVGGGGETGHSAAVAWLPESEQVVAITANSPDITADDLLRQVGPPLAAGDPIPAPAAVSDVDVREVAAHAGTYELDSGVAFEVTAEPDGLRIRPADADTDTDTDSEAVELLFAPPEDIAAELSAHERQVTDLLTGGTTAGDEELDALADDFGPVGPVTPLITLVEDGEPRTYVTITLDGAPLTGWYTLGSSGDVAAVLIDVEAPSLLLTPDSDNIFRPADPSGTAPEVTIEFDDDNLILTTPDGAHTARLAG